MLKDAIPSREIWRKEEKEKRLKARGFSLVCRPGKAGPSRLAIITKKDFGLAVERNRTKRRLRELFRKTKPWLKGRFDIIVIVYPELKEQSFQEIAQEWRRILKKGGIIEENSHISYKNLS